jgi:hypothetical protein
MGNDGLRSGMKFRHLFARTFWIVPRFSRSSRSIGKKKGPRRGAGCDRPQKVILCSDCSVARNLVNCTLTITPIASMSPRRTRRITLQEVLAKVRKPMPPRTQPIESTKSKLRRSRVKKIDEE